MGRTNLLSCLEKRDLLNRSAVSVKELLSWGQRYEEQGMLNDAIDFYERANAPEALEKLLPLAREEGDAFLYGRLLKALNRQEAPREWLALGQRAEELGKETFARDAYAKGGGTAAGGNSPGEKAQS